MHKGLSASLFLKLSGKITGISGIVEESLSNKIRYENLWNLSYIFGLTSSGIILSYVYNVKDVFGEVQLSRSSIITAGLLTGNIFSIILDTL